MHNVTSQSSTSSNVINAAIVSQNELSRIAENADAIRAKAMELTDSWEGVMFALPPGDLEKWPWRWDLHRMWLRKSTMKSAHSPMLKPSPSPDRPQLPVGTERV